MVGFYCTRKATSLKSQTELGSSYEQQRMELLEPSESCSALFKVLVRIGDRFIFHLSKLYTKPIFTHKNLAVRRIVEAMRTAYAKSGTRSHCASKRMRQTITEGTRALWWESAHRLGTTFLNQHRKCFWNVSLVSPLLFIGTHFRIFVRKLLVHHVRCAHLIKS